MIESHASRSNAYLYLTVFTGGMTTLAIELTASRLLGGVFGASNLVWANVIGLILLYLSIGYYIGGRWADRSPHYTTFYRIILWGAFLSALIPLASRPVLRTAAEAVGGAEAALALGSFISVLVLFSAPVTLLGCVSPFAIRLAVRRIEDAGQTAGHIYALSTIGSLIGTFLPGLYLIPELGTFRTFLLFSGLLYVIAFIGLLQHQARPAWRLLWMPLVVTILAAIVLAGPLRTPVAGATLLYEDESAYNYIQVQEAVDGTRYLYLNEGQGIYSQWHPVQYSFGRTWDFFLAAPYFNDPTFSPQNVESLAIVGLAAGTIAHQYSQIYNDIPIDGIEIDPGIVEVAKQYFDMTPESLPNLTVHVQDGRFMLNRLERDYSIIAVDAYRPPYIPWHLTTVEFFQEARDLLTPDGVIAINVGRTETDRRLVDALTNTLYMVFPSVHAIDVPGSFNTILVATQSTTSDSNLANNLALLPAGSHPMLQSTLQLGVTNIVPVQRSDILFTDDRAPVETLIDSLVLNFLLSGEVDTLQSDD